MCEQWLFSPKFRDSQPVGDALRPLNSNSYTKQKSLRFQSIMGITFLQYGKNEKKKKKKRDQSVEG